MKKTILFAAAATAMTLVSTNANAAANLVSATVTGSNGSTVWNTNSKTGFDTVFLQQSGSSILNGWGQAINDPTQPGVNSFVIAGDGEPICAPGSSNPLYTMTLRFADGATISSMYNSWSNSMSNATSMTVGATTYTFTGFSWEDTGRNFVSDHIALPGDNTNDHLGQFSFTAVNGAVPEPATWAMMLAGFGMIGLGLRSRPKVTTSVAYA